MYAYWEHLIHDPITLKDLLVVSFGMSIATIILVVGLALIWAVIDFAIERGRERGNRIHFKRISSHDEISRVE